VHRISDPCNPAGRCDQSCSFSTLTLSTENTSRWVMPYLFLVRKRGEGEWKRNGMVLYLSAVHNTALWREGKKRKGCACCVNSLTRVLECHLFHALRLTFFSLDLTEFRRSFRACPASFIDQFAKINLLSPIELKKGGKMKKWKAGIPQ